jgi:hypothetical protein
MGETEIIVHFFFADPLRTSVVILRQLLHRIDVRFLGSFGEIPQLHFLYHLLPQVRHKHASFIGEIQGSLARNKFPLAYEGGILFLSDYFQAGNFKYFFSGGLFSFPFRFCHRVAVSFNV